MKKALTYLALGIIALTAGCTRYRPVIDFNDQNRLVNRLNAHFAELQKRYWCYRFGFDYVPNQTNPCSGSVENGQEMAKKVRNEFIESAIPFIDESYTNFIVELQAGRDRNNFVADVVELGTGGAIGITNGQRPIQILGVALTAFRGGRRSTDLNFYKEQATPILISKMDDNRAKVRATILNREADDVDDYPIGASISDIIEYYNAGTLVRALTQLQKDTAVQAKESENRVLHLKGIEPTPPATEEQSRIAVKAGDLLSAIRKSLAKPEEEDGAIKKLQSIFKELEPDPDFAPFLTGENVTSEEKDGPKLLRALRSIRRKIFDKGNLGLLDKINQVIASKGK